MRGLVVLLSLGLAGTQAQFTAFQQPQHQHGGFQRFPGHQGGFRGFLQTFQHGMHTVFQPVQQVGQHVQHMGHHLMENFHLPQVQMPHFFQHQNEVEDEADNSQGGVGGTKKPVSTGKDEIYPRDCGRDKDTKKGLLCFPDGKLCQDRVNRQGNVRFGNHLYWVSWLSDDHRLKNANWDWFNARNYCRKRCMDLVSIEDQREYDFLKGVMNPGTKYFWTSGRMCNFDGCDREDFLPKNINGWFWSANQARMNPTNGTRFHDWSQTGGSRPPKAQPDNREKVELHGDDEACMAVLNNFYGDGIKWHDVACHHEKPIICEDVEGHLNFARQTFPELQIP